ncbi:MAG: hypothetical protein KDD56_01410 [Bdellovibrionales bacterium]|nr:hypothetical protein [Bdellovibrionales bacterium]
MTTRKLFTDPTEEHTDCCNSNCNSNESSKSCKNDEDLDCQRPSGKAEDYLGEKL